MFKRVTLLWGSKMQSTEHGGVYWNNSASLLSVPNLGMAFGNSHFLITIAMSGGQGDILVLYDSHLSKEGDVQRRQGTFPCH